VNTEVIPEIFHTPLEIEIEHKFVPLIDRAIEISEGYALDDLL